MATPSEELEKKFERLLVSQSTLISAVSELMGTLNTVAIQQLSLIKKMNEHGDILLRHERWISTYNYQSKDPNEETDEIPAYDPRSTGPLVALKQPLPKE